MEDCSSNLCCLFKKQKQIPQIRMMKTVVLREPTGREIGLRYELGKELGRGEFGITYLCKDRQTGEELACKSISKNKLRTAIDIENVRRQVEIMRHLPEHPNIVSLKYTYEDDNHVHLLMELCQGPDLLDHLVSRGCYTERSAASVIKTIVEVIQICHKHGVMHRNLKSEKFWYADKKETAPLKVTDFCSSIFFKPGERLNQVVGNQYYMAPEVLKRNYGPEIDIWSAGIILYILLCGFPPYRTEFMSDVYLRLLINEGFMEGIIQPDFRSEPWEKASHNAKDLVKKMLDRDPKLRLTAQEVLDHPWLTNVVKKKPDKAKDLVKKMLAAHDVLGHPWLQNPKTAPNVSLGEKVRGKLLQYSVFNQLLITTTSRVIADHLTMEEDREKNRLLPTDLGTTEIYHYEVQSRLYMLGDQNPDVDVQRLINAFDIDKDGYLNYEEFLAISTHLRKRSHEEYVDTAFQYFDKKQSGYIEHEELCKVLASQFDALNKELIKAIMRDVVTYKDRRISYEEVTNRSLKLMEDVTPQLLELLD